MTDDSNDLPIPADEGAPATATDQRIGELDVLMSDTMSEYWRGPKAVRLQAEYRDLIDLQDDAVSVPDDSEPTADDLIQVEGFRTPTIAEVAVHFGTGPDADAKATEAINNAQMILEATPEADRGLLDSSVASLADATRIAIITELSRPAPARAEHASQAVLQRLEKHGCGDLLREWGIGAARRVGIANERVNNIIDACATDEDADVFITWFDNLTAGEMMAIMRTAA